MKTGMSRGLLIAALSVAAPGFAFAADECTAWTKQPDGSEWRLCTSEKDGHRYCQERRGSSISNVKCS